MYGQAEQRDELIRELLEQMEAGLGMFHEWPTETGHVHTSEDSPTADATKTEQESM